jgi:MerR family transcriptional regulator, thiopeptide resistance regulator
MGTREYTVGEVARLAGVTVRTLHHYDEIGLLHPSTRSGAGYRRYSAQDLARLQRILAYRELGFSLEETTKLLDDPSVDELEQLRQQHALMAGRRSRLENIITAIEKTMEARRVGIQLTPQEMLEVFQGFDPTQYTEEAESRWGDSDAYRESVRRTSSYTKDDWLRIKAEADDLSTRLAAALTRTLPPDSPEAMDLAEEHRQQITRWFYECSYDVHRGLADLYVADERFAANYERYAAGLTQFLHDAIHANAARGQDASD